MSAVPTAEPKMVNLALQGGGAHGAYTWGVLDYLLEDGRIGIEAISGTSAGAMNAVVMAEGLMRGGREGARESLHRFWKAVSDASQTSPLQRNPINVFMGDWSLDNSPGFIMMDLMNRITSPYDLNPFNINPLRDVLAEVVDFELVRCCTEVKLFISATNVETGRVKVFDWKTLTPDMVMASACLPFMFQAVEIDGVPYWDGGYMGNPALFPFFNACASRDVVVVQINPIERPGVPKSAREILGRVNEITFNASLLREFRAIDFVSRLIEDGKLDAAGYKQVLIHRIAGEEALNPLGASSKLNAEWAFLRHLFNSGRDDAAGWLNGAYEDIGTRSTVDIRSMFQGN